MIQLHDRFTSIGRNTHSREASEVTKRPTLYLHVCKM